MTDKVKDLGLGTSFNIENFEDEEELTADNLGKFDEFNLPDNSTAAFTEIAKRVLDELRTNPKIKPTSWGEVLRGLELMIKFKQEFKPKKDDKSMEAAVEALNEFQNVLGKTKVK